MTVFYLVLFGLLLCGIIEIMKRRKQTKKFVGRNKMEIRARRETFIFDNHMEKQVFFDAVALISKRLHLSKTAQELISPEDRIGYEIVPDLRIFAWLSLDNEIDWLMDDIYDVIDDKKNDNIKKLLGNVETVGDIILIYTKLNKGQRETLQKWY